MVTGETAVKLNVKDKFVPGTVAVTCTGPLIPDASRTVFEARPFTSVVVVVAPSEAAPAGATVQFTLSPASPAPAALSTETTSGAANACPACAVCELPEICRTAPGVAGVAITLIRASPPGI